MNITTDSITIGYPPTKKDIIQRLFQQGHIDFNEMWILLQDEPQVKYVPMPAQQIPYQDPWNPFKQPQWTPPYPNDWHTTYTQDPANVTGNPRFYHRTGRSDDSAEP